MPLVLTVTALVQLFQSECLQEWQRCTQRDQDALKAAETAALLLKQIRKHRKRVFPNFCVSCGKHCDSSRCFKMCPHLPPRRHSAQSHMDKQSGAAKFFIAASSSEAESSSAPEKVCLPTSINKSQVNWRYFLASSLFSSHWIVDSGCSSHSIHDRTAFTTYRSIFSSSRLDLGAHCTAFIVGCAEVSRTSLLSEKRSFCRLEDVLHVLSLRYRQLSASAVTDCGIRVQSYEQGVVLRRQSDFSTLGTGSLIKRLYTLNAVSTKTTSGSCSCQVCLSSSLVTWQERLAHVNTTAIQLMTKLSVVDGAALADQTACSECVGCSLGKSLSIFIPETRQARSKNLLKVIHTDVLGAVEAASLETARNFVSFIDDFSR